MDVGTAAGRFALEMSCERCSSFTDGGSGLSTTKARPAGNSAPERDTGTGRSASAARAGTNDAAGGCAAAGRGSGGDTNGAGNDAGVTGAGALTGGAVATDAAPAEPTGVSDISALRRDALSAAAEPGTRRAKGLRSGRSGSVSMTGSKLNGVLSAGTDSACTIGKNRSRISRGGPRSPPTNCELVRNRLGSWQNEPICRSHGRERHPNILRARITWRRRTDPRNRTNRRNPRLRRPPGVPRHGRPGQICHPRPAPAAHHKRSRAHLRDRRATKSPRRPRNGQRQRNRKSAPRYRLIGPGRQRHRRSHVVNGAIGGCCG